MDVSVIIPTHNPHEGRLRRTLAGLRAQGMDSNRWETLVIDNATSPPLDLPALEDAAPANLRIIREPLLGLTHARRRGFTEAGAPILLLVDDDNVLEPDYLGNLVRLFAEHPRVGACGGRSLAEFERQPNAWQLDFIGLLALRDYGDTPRISNGLRPNGSARIQYPVESAPIGAGMGIRRAAAQSWLADTSGRQLSDRRGGELTSGGDNDIVLTVMEAGWEVAYFPELRLTHLIPAARLDEAYLARLNRGIQKSWMQALTKHGANPWPAIAAWTVPLRKAKAWWTNRAWTGPTGRILWEGACGHFEGRVRPGDSP